MSCLTDTGPEVIPGTGGALLLPSAVAAAAVRIARLPECGARFFKRDLGTDRTWSVGGRVWTSIELSAVILKEARAWAEAALGALSTVTQIRAPRCDHRPGLLPGAAMRGDCRGGDARWLYLRYMGEEPAATIQACVTPAGYAAAGDDCDDTAPSVSPGAAEACNGADDDCDGEADDGLATSAWYRDDDGYGYGDPATRVDACAGEVGDVEDGTDCDDGFPRDRRRLPLHRRRRAARRDGVGHA